MRLRKTIVLVAVVLVALVAGVIFLLVRDGDSDASPAGFRLARELAREFASSPAAGRLDFRLASIAAVAQREGRRGALERARNEQLETRGRRVRVIVEGAPTAQRRVAQAIRSVNGSVEARYRNLTQALVPPHALHALALKAGVRFVRPPASRSSDAAVLGEGVAATNAAAWHARGYTGAGVTIAIIDTGFAGLEKLIREGEIPASAAIQDHCSGNFARANHGAAVAEIVHEVAPRARLLLICVGRSEVQLGQAYTYARRQNAAIVSHSVSWYTEGRGDGTGAATTPAGIVADAWRNGILWVNSAGNRADREHWHGTFDDSDGDGFHNFAPDDNSNTLEFGPDDGCLTLKWDDWPLSSEDYNLVLTEAGDDVPIHASANPQTGRERPTEEICHEPPFRGTFDLKIARLRGFRSMRLDLYSWGGGAPSLQFFETSSSLTEPGSSPNAMAVGAVCWRDDAVAAYSSRGPTIDGRIKPDIAAATSVSNATYGGSVSCGQGGFPGTSSSTPHVAGVAALVKQRFPASTPDQLQTYLEQHATDLGAQGKDNDTGAGKLVLPAP